MKKAFTMAEILLSLTIIGVVAAITLPSLTGNINERTWNTQRKALYARFSQAVALMPALNGYGTYIEGNESTSAVDTLAETFITSGLSKVLKINNICDGEHLTDCGIPEKLTTYYASTVDFPATWADLNARMTSHVYAPANLSFEMPNYKSAAFETANGESIVLYYNPNCSYKPEDNLYLAQNLVCANMIYDLNGNKGPNTMGKDMGFMTVFYASDPVVVAPEPYLGASIAANWNDSIKYCKNIDNGIYRLPNVEELASIFVNQKVHRASTANGNYWSATSVPGRSSWAYHMTMGGTTASLPKDREDPIASCVKR